ncbi:MAG: ATP-binding protein [Thermodesulfobacteriota bacterium]
MKGSSPFRRLTFRTKISLSIISILVVFGVSLSLIISLYVSEALLNENRLRGICSSVNLSARVIEPILSVDFLELQNLADEIPKTNRDAIYAFVLDRSGDPLAHTFAGGFPLELRSVNSVENSETYHRKLLSTGTDLIDDFAVPVLIGNDRIGTVRIGMSRSRTQKVVTRLLWIIFLSVGTGILLVGLVSTALARAVTTKIQVLHRAAGEIIMGNLDVQTALPPEKHCWQLTSCNRTDCPAYQDTRRRCWYIPGTLCPNCADFPYEVKIAQCRSCDVYKSNAGDELQDLAEFFDAMTVTLKERIEAIKNTEENLKQQQRIFQTILDVTPDIVSLQDQSLRYRAVNKAFCTFAGVEEKEILGKTDEDLFPADEAQQNVQEGREVLRRKTTISVEKELARVNKGLWLHVIRSAVLNNEGEATGILCTSRDITEIKDLQERIIRSQRMETIGQLAAGVAHEINTPLGIILGYAQLSMEDTPKETETFENLLLIEKYARICRTIISDLLRFSKQMESVKKPIDVNVILGQITAVVEHTFRLEKVRVIRDFESPLPLVFADQEKLEQAFINLINNAYDAIGKDGEITLSTFQDSNKREVIIKVSDTGGGIPPEIRDSVFDPFFTTKGVGKGTGLGLSVTFGVVKAHGGTIDFETIYENSGRTGGDPDQESRQETGTIFTIRLPAHHMDGEP